MADGNKQVFYKETPVQDLGLAFRRFFATNFLLRCPACGRGNVAAGPFRVRDACYSCASVYERLPGNYLISISLNFFITCIVTVAVAWLLVARFGFFPELSWVLIGVITLTAILVLRPVRVLTLWLLWMIGFVYPD